VTLSALQADDGGLCRSCGACCSFSKDWPRFSTEDDADLDLIPAEFIDRCLGGLRCDGDRCFALAGEVGVSTSCLVYSIRPDVCRACAPGDDACRLARRHFGLATASLSETWRT
jgi:Fe-S-cluster containining protein